MIARRLRIITRRFRLGRRLYSGTFPSESQVVICGGGVIGCSVAYHLTKLGWNDVVLLEQGRYSP